MRLHTWVLALIALTLVVGAAPFHARALPNNLIVVDPAQDAPADLLSEEERERITHLQSDAVFTLPFSPVSPDDQTVLVTSGERLGFLSLADGSTREITSESLEPFVPLPLLGFSRFSWLDDTTLGALALNLRAAAEAEAFVRLRIDSTTMEVSAEPLLVPAQVAIVSVSPDLRRLLIARLPADEEGEGAAVPVRVRVSRPAPGLDRPTTLALSPALRRQVAEAHRLQPAAIARLWATQEGADGTVDAAPRAIDLLLLTDGEGPPRYLTTIPEASVGLGETWTRDSGRLAVSFYGLPDLDGARPDYDGALLSEEVYRDVTGNLPPAINPVIQNNNTYVVEAASGAVQILRPDAAQGAPILEAHAWAPDGRTLLIKAWHPARLKGRTHLIYSPQFSERTSFRFYAVDQAAGAREVGRLESDLFSGGSFARAAADFVTPDELIFRAAQGTDRHPYYFNRVSGELRNLADRAGSYYNVFSTNQSRRLVFTYTSFTDPPDVYTMGWDGKGLARLTWASEELRVLAGLRQDPVRVTLPGGQTRVGVLIQPASAPFPPKDVPIVVWQEGGPGPAMFNSWESIVERPFGLLPGMGTALLVTPVAGRPGYTPAAFNSMVDGANFGQVDIDEQAAIVRELIRRGWTSQGKVGITGCSYGGYFAAQSIVRHPDLYAAANVQCGFIDLVSEWTRGFAGLAPYMQGLPPYNAPEEYRRDSPAYNAARIKAAVLTFHGTEDFLPIVQNENLHLQLVNRGVTARMVKFVGEGHGLAEAANQHYAAQEQIVWFRTHLK